MLDIPKWIIASNCPSCEYCVLLNGTKSPYWCVEDVVDIPFHVTCSFDNLYRNTTSTENSPSLPIYYSLLVITSFLLF
ncbi:unnamed protein product [Caenorhabditis brenneri]